MTDIIDKFNELAEKIKNSSANPNVVVPDDIKLKFYAYYKQATIGDCNTECPGMFEFQKKQCGMNGMHLKEQQKMMLLQCIFITLNNTYKHLSFNYYKWNQWNHNILI